MSALIKNMDIPSSCMRCRLLVHDEFENYYSCPASNRSFDFDEDIKNYEECKPEWCPLEEGVPIIHGHWKNKYERYYLFFGICSVCKHICQENNICGNCGAIMDEEESKNV